jgi:hypothetical protein
MGPKIMTHISPCKACGVRIIYQREPTEEDKRDSNFVLFPELQMHNFCPKCKTYLFSYPLTLDSRWHSQLEGTKGQ